MERWYIACHKAGKQNAFKAMAALCMSNCAVFHPQISVSRDRSDRPDQKRQVIEALFPGYLFVSFDPEKMHTSRVELSPGISYLVRSAGQIKPVRESVIEEIMRLPLCSQERRPASNLIQQRQIARRLDEFVKSTPAEERGALFLAFLATLET
ncbi:transcription termination/antitermination NusG family protein [Enterobacter asburiae]|uniref:transcription termination/antitermination NusG family protein n=1 Tax=Enterobacter asburiae TaxID=61645 RepID=UPI003F54A251